MNKETFFTIYPEFEAAEAEFPGMAQVHLDAAEKVTPSVWGEKRDQVIALTTAKTLAVTPFGRNANLSSAQGKSTYGTLLKEMRTAFAAALDRQG